MKHHTELQNDTNNIYLENKTVPRNSNKGNKKRRIFDG